MPCNYKDYPKNWKKIVERKRIEAHDKCELCYVPNGKNVIRVPANSNIFDYPWILEYKGYNGKATKIVLTVHHIDSDKTNNSRQNLILLCQRCHLRLDLEKHIRNRREKRKDQNQMRIEGV